MSQERVKYESFIRNRESLRLFMESVGRFDQAFCDHMVAGDDFTLKVEVHGNAGELLHARVSDDGFKRPKGVERKVEDRRRQ